MADKFKARRITMSVFSQFGIFLIIVLFWMGTGRFRYNDEISIPTIWESKNKIKHLFFIAASILLLVVCLNIAGAIGLMLLSPFLEFFDIAPNLNFFY